jgi:hypothetical protein
MPDSISVAAEAVAIIQSQFEETAEETIDAFVCGYLWEGKNVTAGEVVAAFDHWWYSMH